MKTLHEIMNPLFDVVGVSNATHKVRLLSEGKNLEDADAIVKMAVIRRGLDGECFARVPHKKFKDGDSFA